MNLKTLILFLLILFISSGCSTPRFYPELESSYLKGKPNSYLLNQAINGPKIVLKALENELKDSNHVISHFSPHPEWDSKKFSGVIYDVTKEKYYYFKNNEKHPKKLTVSENYVYPNDNYYKFIIENYRDGKIDYLQKLGNMANTSGINTEEVIYEINLKEGKNERHTFKSFMFMDGEPTNDVENE